MPDVVQYYLVDNTLKLRKGKIGAQCGHGALLAHEIFHRIEVAELRDGYKRWYEDGMAKIVLKATPEVLDEAVKEFGIFAAVVIDNGHTEVPPNTRTVVVLPVMTKESAPDWVKALPLL